MRTPFMAIAIASVLCVGAERALAQATTSLRGTVTDSQAALIPQAVVTLTNTETGASRQSVTSAVGEYQFVQVSPGTYQVTAEKPGFSTASQKGVKLQVNTPATLDLQLNVGQTSEPVNVVAELATAALFISSGGSLSGIWITANLQLTVANAASAS